jgi:two-component system C4-dicarboxylate transport response regulator DctD
VKIAPTDANVLIEGETGTGKELIARAIHRRSGRTGRFVPINCGAIPPELVESELFGHEKGAFTGAVTRKDGLFRHAESGTIFLDEIGTIVESTQLRLLRTLQEATVRPVGANEEVPIDVRVVAATSQPLQELVDQQRFRVDLLYRLDVIRLALPALRDRPEDIIFLFAHFALSAAKRYQVERPDVDDRFLDALTAYDWPGNVRQLENFTERLILTHPSPGTLTAEHFDRLIRRDGSRPRPAVPSGNDDAPEPFGRVDTTRELGQALGELVEEAERAYLETCLRENGGRIGETAKHAGISRRTLLRKLRKHGIDKMAFRRR